MSQIQTFYALSGRKNLNELMKEYDLILSNLLTVSILNGIPLSVLILNKERQLVFANKTFLNLMNVSEIAPILGMRIGELLGCPSSVKGEDGCGTSKSCNTCGLTKSVLDSIDNGKGNEEITLSSSTMEMMHLNIKSEMINFGVTEFILLSIQDISSEKKKLLLERIFYHDILNSAHNISSMAELIGSDDTQENKDEYLWMLTKSTSGLIDEINTHRILTNSNLGDYISKPVKINSFLLFKELKSEFEPLSDGHIVISLDKRSENFYFTADRVLIRRVITNMIKNAIEAESNQGKITLGLMALKEKGAMLWVHNQTYMNEQVQMKVFNRSFSTKGPDRGLGTYSMKLLTEKFMKGKISFTSSPTNGTTFLIEIPDMKIE